MTLSYLDAQKLHGAIINGCQCVIAQSDQLNKINVFPVADGDTGSNMSSTARAVIYYSKAGTALKETVQSIAEASLLGARGNSGMIFSQFFNGFNESFTASNQVTLQEFSELLIQAAQSVRQAIATPIDGTMLTIIEAWAENFQRSVAAYSCYKSIMQTVMPSLKQTVESTKEALAALKQSDLVDAGALGFYHFVQGFASYLYNPESSTEMETSFELSESHPLHAHEHSSCSEYRFCTEGILRNGTIDKEALSDFLSQYGDSAVITGSNKLCRFHVHTNEPWTIYSQLTTKGTLEHPKVDDMYRQSQVAHNRQHSIALVTDSCADIPLSFRDEHQIHVIPINIHLDEHQLLDGYSFEPNAFYQSLNSLKHYPKTSLPSAQVIEERIAGLANLYEHVVIVSVSQALSGTYDAFQKVAQKHQNVSVINSKTTAGAQGLLMAYASELISQGVSVKELLPQLQAATDKTHMFVVIDQFESLIRSGRVSAFKGKLAQLAGIKPIITLTDEGKADIYSKARSPAKAFTQMVETVRELCVKSRQIVYKYCIVHAGVEDKALAFSQLTTEAFNKAPEFIENASTAIGLHAGFGAVGLAFMMHPSR